ncbi:MAG: protein phosphatase 2C domain-containing protein [Bacteroidales bacterium]|nr:protein phosphatase 2C domain-containing protein [Bacteroidales bacterium]
MDLQKICTDNNGLLIAFGESRIGGRPENQDSYGWADTRLGYLVTVCDGMGGGPGGKTASSIAVREIINTISACGSVEDPANAITNAVQRANAAIIAAGKENPALKGMGSTATVLLLNENTAYVGHVGDSRVYQIRGSKKAFRTFDHSMVFDMVAQGVITEEQARLSAQSNVITRALGIKPTVEVEVHETPYQKGDRFLLCTDGIHGSLPEKDLLKMASGKEKLGVVVDNICTTVDNLGCNSGGGHDNLTIAMVETLKGSKSQGAPSSSSSKIIIIVLAVLLLASIALNIVLGCR